MMEGNKETRKIAMKLMSVILIIMTVVRYSIGKQDALREKQAEVAAYMKHK